VRDQSEGEPTDKLDIRILKQLASGGPFFPMRPGLGLSHRFMARRLGVSPETVRNRLGRMRSSGFILQSKVIPHPGLLGLQMGAFGVEISPALEKNELIGKLRLIEGVLIVQNHHGNFLGIVLVYEDEASLGKRLELIRRIGGVKEEMFSRILFPPCKLVLKLSEWEMVSRLVKGVPREPSKIADELGISVRTLRRKVVVMGQEGAIYTQPNVNFGALADAVPADLMVVYKSQGEKARAEQEVLRLVDDYIFYPGIWETMDVHSLVLPNPLVATRLAEKVRRVPGVRASRIELVDEHLDQMEAFTGYVDRRIKEIRRSKLALATAV
jgi:DNA-binding Lrp family transcriptional regulator